jgi:long-chain acyl-CoA synthetase
MPASSKRATGHLRIIDRAKDVGKMADGSMFAPKYVENKLKFFPNILEAVVFGNGRDRCVAFINIDLTRSGLGQSATTSPIPAIRNWRG